MYNIVTTELEIEGKAYEIEATIYFNKTHVIRIKIDYACLVDPWPTGGSRYIKLDLQGKDKALMSKFEDAIAVEARSLVLVDTEPDYFTEEDAEKY